MPIQTRASQKPDPEIIITIYDGEAHLETKGFEGKSCTEAVAFLLEDAKNQKVTFKPEYARNSGNKAERGLLA
jgi:hypothetical protein